MRFIKSLNYCKSFPENHLPGFTVHILNCSCTVVFHRDPVSLELEGPVLHSPPPLCPYSMCPPPPLREISGAGYRDTVLGLPQNHPPSHSSCDGPPQVSLLLDNGPSVARWDSDTSFFIRRQAYSSFEVTPPPTPKPLNR